MVTGSEINIVDNRDTRAATTMMNITGVGKTSSKLDTLPITDGINYTEVTDVNPLNEFNIHN
jgi:hypothetical protein